MLFNSYSFIFLYLPITFVGMFFLARYSHKIAALWLAIASLVFYSVWDLRFVLLLLGSISFNYAVGYLIALRRTKSLNNKSILVGAIFCDLALLGYFKYTNFFIHSVNDLFGMHIGALEIILPLGISFFTFTQIAFLVDVYRGIAKEVNFIHYLLFVTYFPHLIAGPILHHKQMMPQFAESSTYKINSTNITVGLTIFVFGLAKKVLLADSFAEFPNPIFGAVTIQNPPMLFESWIAALSYTLQLYFDFSGYTDMAIGISLMFNVRLPMNFNSPYKALSIIDFWRRWHITLSHFLRDYLYIPLGGNRSGKIRRYINLVITMLLGGLWHGAAWTFVIWGGLHGLYLIVNHFWRLIRLKLGLTHDFKGSRFFSGTLTFFAVVIAWVFFRADSYSSAMSIIYGMFSFNGISVSESLWKILQNINPQWIDGVVMNGLAPISRINPDRALILIAIGLLIVFLMPNTQQLVYRFKPVLDRDSELIVPRWQWRFNAVSAWILGIIFVISLTFLSRVRDFLYFQF